MRWGTSPGIVPILGALLRFRISCFAKSKSKLVLCQGREQDLGTQDSLAIAKKAPFAAALMETTSPPLCERQFDSAGSSGALFSGSEEREASGDDVVVNSDDFLVERADHPRAIPASASGMGPRVVKEIIIYNVYDNDDNIVTENNVDPIPTKDGEDLNTNLGVTKNDAANSL